jgi:hypothetical protein
MLAEKMQAVFGRNWKSNFIATLSFLYGVPEFVVAVQHWMKHQPADWRGATGAMGLAALGYVTRDSSNKSTSVDLAAADIKAGIGSRSTDNADALAQVRKIVAQTQVPQIADKK